MGAFSIRPAQLADGDQIADLVTELGYPTSVDQMRRRLHAIQGDPDFSTHVASTHDRIIGFVGTRCGPYYEGDGLYGQIMILVVSHKHRRTGVGRALMQAAEQELTTRGATTLVVGTGNQRSDAHAFYESLGYEFTGRRYKKRR